MSALRCAAAGPLPHGHTDRTDRGPGREPREEPHAMGPGPTPHRPLRAWTVTIHPRPGAPALTCTACGPLPRHGSSAARGVVLAHLARHTRAAPLPSHLCTCQCSQHGCRWHPRHRGCDGPILLLLTRSATGRTWRLADVCRACAAVTSHAAPIPDTLTANRPHGHPGSATAMSASPPGHGESAAGREGVVCIYDPTDLDTWETDKTMYI